MSEPIGPGDMVECVDSVAYTGVWAAEDLLVVGNVYRVKDAFFDAEGDPVITLDGKERLGASSRIGWRAGYWINRFRPISRRSDFEHFLETLKTPAPEELVIA